MAAHTLIAALVKRIGAVVTPMLAIIGITAWHAPAAADGGYAQGEWIQARTEQGCLIFIDRYFRDFETPEAFWANNTFDYQGSGCEPGELLNGTGVLRFHGSGGPDAEYKGQFVDGVAQGPMIVVYPGSPSEFWRNEEYRDGCPAADIYEYGCQPFTGNAVALVPPDRRGDAPALAERSYGGTPSGPSAPAAAPAAASSNGNVWGTCVATVDPYRLGIQMIYGLRNRCDKTITVSFCMKATYESAGDWNLCSQREYKTYDIRAGTTFEFPFTPVTPGTAMSDGRVVDYNEVSARGAACVGSSPSVYIENKDLIFQHC